MGYKHSAVFDGSGRRVKGSDISLKMYPSPFDRDAADSFF
jgi:hypothetical protein